MDVWGHWGSHPECQADGAQAGSSRGLFSLLLLRTLVFKPFLKASCSAHALSLQFQHYLWPATHLCLTQVQESRLRLESSTKCFHETIFPIPHPQTPSFFGFCVSISAGFSPRWPYHVQRLIKNRRLQAKSTRLKIILKYCFWCLLAWSAISLVDAGTGWGKRATEGWEASESFIFGEHKAWLVILLDLGIVIHLKTHGLRWHILSQA